MNDAPPRVYSIPAGIAFADALASGLKDRAGDDPMALASATVIVPGRRALRALSDAFLRVADGKALLLPRLMALAELDGDHNTLDTGQIPPEIDPLGRRLILARLILARGGEFAVAPDQALRLADALADLIDEVQTERLDFARLRELAPEEFAGHWQKTIEFLEIVTRTWPAILNERGAIDPAARRVLALAARAALWRERPPADPVIAAGFIAADPALAALIATVSRLPAGSVVLPGLDRALDNEAWDEVGEIHPQFGMKRLLDAIGIARNDVRDWPSSKAGPARARLLNEALRPAETTARWRTGAKIDPMSLSGLSRVDCATVGQEAEVIALALRHALETPGRTAALVTADRNLARRVAAALKRWNVEIDDSAGQPLSETPVGVWLRLVAEAASTDFAPRPLLAMLKHPLAAGGLSADECRRRVRALECAVLRGPRLAPGIEGLRGALAGATDSGSADERRLLRDWVEDLAVRLDSFLTALKDSAATPSDLLMRHAEAAEALAETPQEPGSLRLWRGQDGEVAADLFARLQGPAGQDLPAIAADRYPAMLTALMAGITVRPLYGAHPRLAIWGLIEARLQRADLMVLGGLNEGSWPPVPGEEPWMSPRMRKDFGLQPLEARIGSAAQDFVLAAAAPEVLLTRSVRVDGAPSVPARWLPRLDTLLAASGLSLPRPGARSWASWAEQIDHPGALAPWPRPEPRPPVQARPRSLPVTAIELWMRDPYALYAQRILKLRPLDPLDADPGAAERGQFVHRALDRFIKLHPRAMPDDAVAALLKTGRAAFGEAISHPSVAAFWWPRFERIAEWFVAFERERRRHGAKVLASETDGRVTFAASGGAFTLTAKADRIDLLPDGRLAIIDYKTGRPPHPVQVVRGLAPQLPLEATIAEQGGFGGIDAAETGELAFLRLSGGNPPGELIDALGTEPISPIVADAWNGLIELVESFDRAEMPYHSRPWPEFAYAGAYDHLARVGEWPTAP